MHSVFRSNGFFLLASVAAAAIVFAGVRMVGQDYAFHAGYKVLQFVVLATAWNILGGFTGYVNFGAAAFFACGVYSTVFFQNFYPLPLPVLVVIGAAVSGLVGLGTGYLTLRLRGVYFAIATLALAVVLRTLVVNWSYLGGSRGAYILRPEETSWPDLPEWEFLQPLQPWLDAARHYTENWSLPYIEYLFLIMLIVAVIAVVIARSIEHSKLGYGFATIRDDEVAAEACGVPTLRLKLIATTLSGALMGMAGAPFPYLNGYLQPSSAFDLGYAVNSIAMPMIGGTASWAGPVLGAVLLGSLDQLVTLTIPSEVSLLIVGILLVDFVIIAPSGLIGLIRDHRANLDIAPAVFALMYVLNLCPLYFLPEGLAAAAIAMVFWIILAFVAYARGRTAGLPWLAMFPLLGAGLWLLPAVSRFAATAEFYAEWYRVAIVAIQIAGILYGVRFRHLLSALLARLLPRKALR
jgi:branched-chain amino acid transport system permease protein